MDQLHYSTFYINTSSISRQNLLFSSMLGYSYFLLLQGCRFKLKLVLVSFLPVTASDYAELLIFESCLMLIPVFWVDGTSTTLCGFYFQQVVFMA